MRLRRRVRARPVGIPRFPLLVAVLLAMALVAAACGGPGGGDATPRADGARGGDVTTRAGEAAAGPSERTGTTVAQVPGGPREDVPSALAAPAGAGLPTPTVPIGRLLPGGPPPDGIPPIDEPRFLPAAEVGFVRDGEPVLAFELAGEARAYPVQVMIWHEIVNDTVGGVPVSVTYCPLCNSAVAVDRRLGDRTLDFGTSGLLYNSALVMYDRQTESLWSHFTGEAVAGVLTGERLRMYPVATVAWADWRDAHPDGLVLSRDTGFQRDYGRNPYPGYDDVETGPFLFDGEVDGRLSAMARVVGIERGGDAVAVRLDALVQTGVLDVEVAGERLVAWVKPGMASALDASSIEQGRDVGAVGVFVPRSEGRELHFRPDADHLVDDETGTRWTVLGEAVDGPLAGQRLEAVVHVDTFWFAWASFLPGTTVVP